MSLPPCEPTLHPSRALEKSKSLGKSTCDAITDGVQLLSGDDAAPPAPPDTFLIDPGAGFLLPAKLRSKPDHVPPAMPTSPVIQRKRPGIAAGSLVILADASDHFLWRVQISLSVRGKAATWYFRNALGISIAVVVTCQMSPSDPHKQIALTVRTVESGRRAG